MKAFLMFYNNYEFLRNLTDQQLGQILRTIYLQELEPNTPPPTLDPLANMVLQVLMRDVKSNEQKYKEKCEKARESIKKRWEKEAEKKQQNTTEYDRIRPNTTEYDRIHKEITNVKSNEITNEITNETDLLTCVSKSNARSAESVSIFLSVFKKSFPDSGEPTLSATDKKNLQAVLAQYGAERVQRVIAYAAATETLNGKSKSRFVARPSWLLKHFAEVSEAEQRAAQATAEQQRADEYAERMREIERQQQADADAKRTKAAQTAVPMPDDCANLQNILSARAKRAAKI